jgi:chorismate-pyruvate lyase
MHDPYSKSLQLFDDDASPLKGGIYLPYVRQDTMKSYAVFLMGLLFAGTAAGEGLFWHDTFLARVEALALIETLNADLLAAHSATLTLEQWCATHHIAGDAKIHAQRVEGPEKPISAEQRARLHLGTDEPVKYRHVALACGDHILSEADNWYVPARLTPEMNRLLETTDTPFGRVVQPLQPTRENFASILLWRPLEQGWEMARPQPDHPEKPLDIPEHLFEHRALLLNADHEPFSEVTEIYTRAILDFAVKD